MLENLREASSIEEVLSVLDHCSKKKLGFTLWQTIKGQRVQSICNIVFFTDRNPCNIVVEIEDQVKYLKEDIIYLYQEELKFLFKGKINSIKANRISITSSGELYLKEKRETPRIVFDDISFVLKVHYEDRNSFQKSFEADLLDLSEKGACFCIPAQRGSMVFEGMELNLFALESIEFQNEIKAKISYIKPFKTKFGQTDLRIGVEFEKLEKNISIALQLLRNKKREKSS